MAGALDVMVKFLADASGIKDEVDKVEGTGAKIKDWAGKAALAVGGAFAVDKIVEFGKASVNAAAEDAQAQAILAQTLKNTSGATDAQVASVEKQISALSKATAIADDDLRPAMDTLARAVKDPTKAMDLLKLSTDVAAGTGKDLAAVSTAIAKGAMGSTGALGKLGIATKDAAGHTLAFDQITQNLATTFKGQAAVAADTTAGKMQNAQIQFREFQEQIGSYLLPAVGAMAAFFTNTLLPAISAVVNFVADHKDLFIAAFVGLAVVVGGIVIPAFISWAVAAGAAAIATLAAAAPFIAIGAVIAAVAFVIIHNWQTIQDTAITVWNAVYGAIKFVWDWVAHNWPLLLAILLGPITAAGYLIWKFFGQDIQNWVQSAINFIVGAWNGLVGFFTGLPGRLAGIFHGMWDGILNAFRSVINGVIDLWNRLHFTLPHIDLGPLGSIGGGTIGVPQIPHLAQGGLIAQSGIAVVHAGERVVPAGGGGPAVVINDAHFSSEVDVESFMRRVAWTVQTQRI